MKLNITVDCTPEEARQFLGLPDMGPINETLTAAIRERIEQNVELVSPDFYLRQWHSMSNQRLARPWPTLPLFYSWWLQ